MTKKSKRAVVKNPTGSKTAPWDELHEMHTHCVRMIAGTAYIGKVLKDPTNLKQVKDHNGLLDSSKSLLEVLTSMEQALAEIYKSHKDRRGGSTNPMDNMDAIVFGEAYYEWISNFNEFVLPHSEQFKQAIAGGDVVYA